MLDRIVYRKARALSKSAGRARGQSTVELAVTIPLLIGLLMVAFDYSRALFMSLEVAGAAETGAQYGAQSHVTAADIAGIEQAACASMADVACTAGSGAVASTFCQCAGSSSQISCASPGSCGVVQSFVKVTTSATFHPAVAYPGLPASIPISSTTIMQVQ